jgi:hypothetical protein
MVLLRFSLLALFCVLDLGFRLLRCSFSRLARLSLLHLADGFLWIDNLGGHCLLQGEDHLLTCLQIFLEFILELLGEFEAHHVVLRLEEELIILTQSLQLSQEQFLITN